LKEPIHVRDAWLYSKRKESAHELGAALVELGYRPRYLSEHESDISPRDGAGVRPPELAIVVTGAGEEPQLGLLRRLRASERLREAAVLLTVDPEHLRTSPEAALAHELLVKPFSIDELRTRVERATRDIRAASSSDVVRDGSLELNLASYRVSVDRRPVNLRYMEFELLKFLMTHPDRVFSREALLSCVWGYDYYGGARTVDVHVRRVRLKLGAYAERIKTVRSVGYLFEPLERLGALA
jgi:DNA-binding response OmpR family regulator